MAEGTASPVVSPVASALSSSVSSPRGSGITPDDKACDLIEEAVPMVIVQQFIKDNKEERHACQPTDVRLEEEAGGD